MTPEERKNLPKKRANRDEIDAFYLLSAALSALMSGEEYLESRAKLMPGGWRDLRMLRSRLENFVLSMLNTFEVDKQRHIGRQMQYLKLKTVFGPEAAKDPEMFMLPIEDVGLLVHAATQECKLHMCSKGDCSRCQLGRVLDRCSFVTRGDRAWWEVFEQANHRDVGMEDAE